MPLSRGIAISRTITSGLVLGGEFEERAAVAGGADDFAPWLQQTPEGVQEHRVVVGEKDAGAAVHWDVRVFSASLKQNHRPWRGARGLRPSCLCPNATRWKAAHARNALAQPC